VKPLWRFGEQYRKPQAEVLVGIAKTPGILREGSDQARAFA